MCQRVQYQFLANIRIYLFVCAYMRLRMKFIQD